MSNKTTNTKLEQWLWIIADREDKWELYESRRLAIMDYNTGKAEIDKL